MAALNLIREEAPDNPHGWSAAWFDQTQEYRYILVNAFGRRECPPKVRRRMRWLVFIMLNPSTAVAHRYDATVIRCVSRAKALGYDGVIIINLFAWRSPDPSQMKAMGERAIGNLNDAVLFGLISRRVSFLTPKDELTFLAAWGTHGVFMGRAQWVMGKLTEANIQPVAIEITKYGHPKHPLYCANGGELIPYSLPEAA